MAKTIAVELLPHRINVNVIEPGWIDQELGTFVAGHLRGEPWARIGEWVGQRNLAVTANTYTHVLTDEAELDYRALLRA